MLIVQTMGCPFSQGKSWWQKVKGFFAPCSTDTPETFSVENLQAILDTTVDSVITMNENQTILLFNKAAEKTFGYSKEETLGEKVTMLMPEPYHSEHTLYVQNYLKTGKMKIIGIGREAVAKKKDGTTFPIHLAVSEVFINQVRFFTAILQDLTQQKEAEKTLQENIALEAELHAKKEYATILIHELRTPLTSIIGSLELLKVEQGLSKKVQELLSISHTASQRLATIVEDLIDIEKIHAGKMEFDLRPICILDIIKEAIATLEPLATKMDVALVEEIPVKDLRIFADPNRLVQVIVIFLSNAIKFSPPHAQVVTSAIAEGNTVRVSVRDRGPGIPEDFQKRMFIPFSRAIQTDSRIAGGRGLSLYISKCIIEHLQGTIGFSSKENEGSTFYFEFPIYRDELPNELKEKYQKSLPEKLALIQQLIKDLHQAITREHLSSLHFQLHKLAGNAGTFGYPKISQLCRTWEERLIQLIDQFPECQKDSVWLDELDMLLIQLRNCLK